MLDAIAAHRTLRAAFERVAANGGCRGADGVTVGASAAASTPSSTACTRA